MAPLRTLRGACQCGRNRYVIQAPKDSEETAQVLFHSNHTHQLSFGTPLPAFLRVPISWYHSSTHALLPDETPALIKRVYTHPNETKTQRHFCGFCGTPLSFWTEAPLSEAEYIQLTLGSLAAQDLLDLEDMGLIPDLDEMDSPTTTATARRMSMSCRVRQHKGIPWMERLVENSQLGRIRVSQGADVGKTSRVEWEVVEYEEGEDTEPSDDETVQPVLA